MADTSLNLWPIINRLKTHVGNSQGQNVLFLLWLSFRLGDVEFAFRKDFSMSGQ